MAPTRFRSAGLFLADATPLLFVGLLLSAASALHPCCPPLPLRAFLRGTECQ